MIEKITLFIVLSATSALIFYALLPISVKNALREITDIFMSIIVDSIEIGYKFAAFTNGILHIIGRILTSLLLFAATFILCKEAIEIFSNSSLTQEEQYLAIRTLFTKPYTWAAATTIVATTVAIANIRKYHLDRKDFQEKQRERSEKRAAEKSQKEKERKEARKLFPSSPR